jgi:hypothetical protein
LPSEAICACPAEQALLILEGPAAINTHKHADRLETVCQKNILRMSYKFIWRLRYIGARL